MASPGIVPGKSPLSDPFYTPGLNRKEQALQLAKHNLGQDKTVKPGDADTPEAAKIFKTRQGSFALELLNVTADEKLPPVNGTSTASPNQPAANTNTAPTGNNVNQQAASQSAPKQVETTTPTSQPTRRRGSGSLFNLDANRISRSLLGE